MEPRSQTSATLEPLPAPVDQLYRMSPEVYAGLVDHGLLNASEGTLLVNGLLIHEPAGTEGASTDPLDRLYRIPLEVYHEIAEIGLLGPSDKVVLLDGILVKKMSKGDPRVSVTLLVSQALRALGERGWHVRPEAPVALSSGPAGRPSVPEPDVSVVRGAIRDYLARTPTPADTVLVVELADSSLRKDRVGLAWYSCMNIPVTWIVNLNNQTVEVYSRPTGPVPPAKYQEMTTYALDDEIPVVLDGQEVGKVAVKDLLP